MKLFLKKGLEGGWVILGRYKKIYNYLKYLLIKSNSNEFISIYTFDNLFFVKNMVDQREHLVVQIAVAARTYNHPGLGVITVLSSHYLEL